ncbi:MAG: CBS domain-containing protein [Clostridiales bacterium]|nr:CBS domain-containing protein [Clostridiales bacterium]
MEGFSENARRFISAYNQIDQSLRNQCDLTKSISYTEAIRKASRFNALVKRNEDKLIDYGRLRNAIVHSFNEDSVIAEPHTNVVEEYERLAKAICTPPLAIDTVLNRDIKTVAYDTPVKDVVESIYKTGVSNWPVYKDGMLIGVANSRKLIKEIGKKIYEKKDLDEYLENTKIEDAISNFGDDTYYTIANKDVTLDKILNMFSENRKLALIVITETGSLLELPIGVVAIADIMDVNKILDNY